MDRGVSVAEAQARVLGAAAPNAPITLPAAEALGRVLAETVHAPRTLPPADCSAMDGYAVRAVDLVGARGTAPVRLPVVYEVPAGGSGPRPLAAGEAARIFTGAPLPEGADSVVRQEDTTAGAGTVSIAVSPAPGDHVRRAGEDVAAGDPVLEAGTRLGPSQLGMLAALSRTLVSVHRPPRVALLSGGDELVEPDRAPGEGQIVSSNSYSLAAQCREAGAETFSLGIARDEPADVERLLRAGLGADLLVSSAGVSVGDHDHVRPVLEKLGCRLHFWGVRMKPGYPLAFGSFEPERGPLVFGLPGNPVSAMVTFEQFVRPVIRRMLGHRALFRPTVEAVLAEPLRKQGDRLHFVRVGLRRSADGYLASSTGNQSSGVLRSMVLAQGLLVFPAERSEIAAGERATVQVLDPEFFSSSESGL